MQPHNREMSDYVKHYPVRVITFDATLPPASLTLPFVVAPLPSSPVTSSAQVYVINDPTVEHGGENAS